MASEIHPADLPPEAIREHVHAAGEFHAEFLANSHIGQAGLHIPRMPEWGHKLIRRSPGIPHAVLEKLGSNSIAKRRPKETQAFLAYLERCFAACAPIYFRVIVGPVKNVQRSGGRQLPDLAEYLMLIQLARVMESIAAIYPYGVKVQMVPDDKRGGIANDWPASYGRCYIGGLQKMVADLQFSPWLEVEDGQTRLYALYEIERHTQAATQAVLTDPGFAAHFKTACTKARQNLVPKGSRPLTDDEVRHSAMRYLVALKAEILSGMWSPEDAFPLIYAHHPDSYQLYTMARGLTKLPWQILLPFSLLDANVPALSVPQRAATV